jgi:hypothetical protein
MRIESSAPVTGPIRPIHFDTEDEGSKYLRNVGNSPFSFEASTTEQDKN